MNPQKVTAFLIPFLTWILWTNPCDPDLARIKFYITAQDSFHGAYIVNYPLYNVAFGDTTWRSRPCAPDSLTFTGACRSAPTLWALIAQAVDWTGNESDPSNGGIPVEFVILPP